MKPGSKIESLLGRKRVPSRGPKPALSVTQIANAAIEIADAEGLAAVTMQRVAREVRVTTMALYRYFPGKADLVRLMIDSAGDSAPCFGKPSSPWNVRLKEWAHRCSDLYRDHPWLIEATSARPGLMGPNELFWMEAALAMLAEAGLTPKQQHHAFFAIIGLVRGHATFHQMSRLRGPGQAWIDDLANALKEEEHRFSNLLAVIRSGAFAADTDTAFDFGLDCVLGGIRERVKQRRARPPQRLG